MITGSKQNEAVLQDMLLEDVKNLLNFTVEMKLLIFSIS